MPMALATSKRKFHKLLDSLTSANTTADRPSTPAGTASERVSKRPRLTPRSRLAASHPLVNSSTNLRSIRRVPSEAVSRVPQAIDPQVEKEPPNYAPWNRDHFRKRLQTFTKLGLWDAKPQSINEVAWARRGWVCEGKNRVACKGGCEERVVISLRPKLKDDQGKEIDGSEDYSQDVSQDLVKRYEELIVDGHKSHCLWRASGCNGDIMRMPLARPAIWQPSLRERYSAAQQAQEALPDLERIKQPCDLDIILSQLDSDFFLKPPAATPAPISNLNDEDQSSSLQQANKAALAFAMLGWNVTKDRGRQSYATATCSECYRRVGLWLYSERPATSSSNYSKRATSLESSRSTVALTLDDDSDKLDLVESHRDFCPWINDASQATPGPLSGLSGWQILEKVIANWANVRARTGKQQERQSALLQIRTPSSGDAADLVTEKTISSNLSEVVAMPAEEQEEEQEEISIIGVADAFRNREQVRREDEARFARLRELSRLMGFKRFKAKP